MRKGSYYGLMALALFVVGLGTAAAQQPDEAVPAAPQPAPAAPLAPIPASPVPPAGACPSACVPLGVSPGCSIPDNCPPTVCPLPEYPLPCVYARMRGLALKRDSGERIDFATLGTESVLNTSDVRFPFQGGGEITAGIAVVPSYYVEFSYFGLSSWDQSAAVRNNDVNALGATERGNLMSPFGGFGTTPSADYDYNNYAAVGYRSQLDNYEINLRHQLPMPAIPCRSSFLFGGRAMRIDDDLLLETEADRVGPPVAEITNSLHAQTQNRLLGLQIGGLFEFHCDPGWWVNLDLKGAICQNKIDLDSIYTNVGGTTVTPGTYHLTREESQTSFIGEVGLSFVYEFGRCVTADVGYRAIWVTGLATGAENLQTDVNLATLGPPALCDDRTAVYHGPHAGLTVRF